MAIQTQVNGSKKLLSAGTYASNPNNYVLYVKDGSNSLGAVWNIYPTSSETDTYVIENEDLIAQGSSGYWYDVYNLVIGANGQKINFGQYQNKRTQQFEIRPVDTFVLESIEYINDGTAYFEQIPDFEVFVSFSNNTSTKQTFQFSMASKATKTSTFSNTTSLSLNISTDIKCGVPVFASGKISTSLGTSSSYTYGQSESQEDTRNYNFPIETEPGTKVDAKLCVSRYNLNVRYIATLVGKNTSKKLKVEGVWSGVDCTDIRITLNEINLNSNVVTRKVSLSNVPTETVRMSNYPPQQIITVPLTIVPIVPRPTEPILPNLNTNIITKKNFQL
ncbi:MAG: hypothetical protein LBG77_00340 [Dysgonamonadaceae bacterium]|jgi:hypothetical protein|nr:hypothetical protein [Dysgonamonadaceae bacterium]